MPFWFWNDSLSHEEIIRQINDFEQHGVHGFVIHPRVGLPRSLAWMSEELLDFYEIAIKEARRREMKVLLYDEGMYPSGSSGGQVVQANPDFQCRCLAKVEHVDGNPYTPKPDENVITTFKDNNGIETSIIDRKVNSRIRGLHYIDEGPDEDAPLAADILNPKAVDCFINLVYRKFAERFNEYFSNTIIGIFTDEPNVLGRCQETNVFPSTRNLVRQINEVLGYDFIPHLPNLWSTDETEVKKYSDIYNSALNKLLQKNYYSKLSVFCNGAGIALTGHPASPEDIEALRSLDIPGQDLVWRYVVPDTPSALEGPQSTQAKCSASAMIHTGKRRNLNECCGAYGHELTWDEMVWLTNWCMIRGVNMIVPHAFYYSTRGYRKDERPPALGPNSKWWNKYKKYADMVARLSWINTDCSHICHVGILVKSSKLPWQSAKACFENQIDFNYIEERHLWEDAEITENGIHLAGMHYKVLIIEFDEDKKADTAIAKLELAGRVIRYKQKSDDKMIVEFVKNRIPVDVSITPSNADLRLRHVVKNSNDYYMLFNETDKEFEVSLRIPSSEFMCQFNLMEGNATSFNGTERVKFQPYEMKVFIRSS